MGLSFYDLQLNNSDTRLSAIVVLRFISITQTSSPFYQAMTTSQERPSYQGQIIFASANSNAADQGVIWS